jgi:hypothetical protein
MVAQVLLRRDGDCVMNPSIPNGFSGKTIIDTNRLFVVRRSLSDWSSLPVACQIGRDRKGEYRYQTAFRGGRTIIRLIGFEGYLPNRQGSQRRAPIPNGFSPIPIGFLPWNDHYQLGWV